MIALPLARLRYEGFFIATFRLQLVQIGLSLYDFVSLEYFSSSIVNIDDQQYAII